MNVFDCGLVIPHYGTIVVGEGNKIGKYCVLHTCTCIIVANRTIGDGFYLSKGATLVHDFYLGNNVTVAANSLVNGKNDEKYDCVLMAGSPAKVICQREAWYNTDGERWEKRVEESEKILNGN